MGWIEKYIEYAKNNEALPQFHLWTGLAVLGAVLRRNVEFSKGYYKVFPNLWVLIVAPSGMKKTTATSIGVSLLTKMDNVKILADKSSPEELAYSLSERENPNDPEAQGVIFAPELANFMDRRSHNDGLVQLLLRLADCPDSWLYATRSGGKVPLKNVAVTVLAATANDLLYDCIPPLALKSGFLARFICVDGEGEPGIVPFSWKDASLESELLNELHTISLLKGQMRLPVKAQEWYVAWYFRHKARIAEEPLHRLRAYFERKPDYLLRIAMIFAISETKVLEFTVRSFELAEKALTLLEPGLERIYSSVDATLMGKEQKKLLEMIQHAGGRITHSELLRKSHTALSDSTNFKRLLQVLIESRQIVMSRKGQELIYTYGKIGR